MNLRALACTCLVAMAAATTHGQQQATFVPQWSLKNNLLYDATPHA